eukprot:m.9319 g.9319  ORF g.9319 m.9319 type:complete len:97 (-) comp9408_c1_seq4:918-1208(-)
MTLARCSVGQPDPNAGDSLFVYIQYTPDKYLKKLLVPLVFEELETTEVERLRVRSIAMYMRPILNMHMKSRVEDIETGGQASPPFYGLYTKQVGQL